MLHLVQDQDQETKSNAESGDEDNTYTEVVYLEQDALQDDTNNTKIPSSKPKSQKTFSKPSTTHNRPKKRKRNDSSDDSPIITIRKESQSTQKDESELDTFIKYIRCLLKKLTPEAFSQVQVDILKTIMDAQYASKITVTNNTVTAPSILSEIANGSVSNIIRVSEITDNVLGNYTVSLAQKNDNSNIINNTQE